MKLWDEGKKRLLDSKIKKEKKFLFQFEFHHHINILLFLKMTIDVVTSAQFEKQKEINWQTVLV